MSLQALIKLLTILGLIGIMLSIGFKVRIGDILTSARKPRQLIMSLVANYVLVPAVTWGLLYLIHADPMVAVGFLLLAICPGAPVGPPFVAIAKGDVPFAIGQMVILSCLCIVVSPALLPPLLDLLHIDGELRISPLAIGNTLLVVQLLPLCAGLLMRHWLPELTGRIARVVELLASTILLAAIILILFREQQSLAGIRLRGWGTMFVLLFSSLGIGWVCGGPDRKTRKALALTTSARNIAVALVIVSTNLAGTPAVPAVVAYGLISILGTFVGACGLALFPESSGSPIPQAPSECCTNG